MMWLRTRTIDFLLDCICFLLPPGERYELIIEQQGESVVALLTRLREEDARGR